MRPAIVFTYLNHRGKVGERHVELDSIDFLHNPGWGYQPGWFLTGYDRDKKARRSFALSRIIMPEDKSYFGIQITAGKGTSE